MKFEIKSILINTHEVTLKIVNALNSDCKNGPLFTVLILCNTKSCTCRHFLSRNPIATTKWRVNGHLE